jgi:hypothetical protein
MQRSSFVLGFGSLEAGTSGLMPTATAALRGQIADYNIRHQQSPDMSLMGSLLLPLTH